jgi:hypothetical protein
VWTWRETVAEAVLVDDNHPIAPANRPPQIRTVRLHPARFNPKLLARLNVTVP